MSEQTQEHILQGGPRDGLLLRGIIGSYLQFMTPTGSIVYQKTDELDDEGRIKWNFLHEIVNVVTADCITTQQPPKLTTR
jgi:hypothetical protein